MIKDITTQCWILALFVRDDGERILLGSGNYEFREKQMHFYANRYVNDTVDIQGNDGLMLAGQVRRASTQPFDGYIGGPSYTQQEVEQYRRDFLKFFRKNHYYEVIYIFQDGTAIKRNKGFIVDAPEVKEIRQLSPEYHVSLNFEDVNYYEYQEDADGNEIYSDSANIPLSTVSSGGLIWDEYGIVWQFSGTGSETRQTSGTSFTIVDGSEIQTLDKLSGDTAQQTYSGKNLIYTTSGTYDGVKFEYDSSTGATSVSGTPRYTYAVSGKKNLAMSSGDTYTLSINKTLPFGVCIGLFDANNVRNVTVQIVPGSKSTTITLSKNIVAYDVYVNSLTVGAPISGSFNIQLEKNPTATDFEPYVGGIASPNPDYPQTIHVVTGEQTITISNGMGQSKTKTIDLGSIELCKLNGRQDYIYKNGENWYIHKETGKKTVDGTTGGYNSDNKWYYDSLAGYNVVSGSDIKSDHFIGTTRAYMQSNLNTDGLCAVSTTTDIILRNLEYSTENDYRTWLSQKMPTFYFQIATPTETQITDATLITQLEDLDGLELYSGTNNVVVVGDDLAPNIHITYLTAGLGGAVWEDGGGAGISNVQVDSIDMVYPVLTINGPAQSPTIENLTTNTAISFAGNINSSQTLVIDSRNQTALLNGTSVVTNIEGDWPVFAPGINRVSYTAENDTAPDALIEWSEVVG